MRQPVVDSVSTVTRASSILKKPSVITVMTIGEKGKKSQLASSPINHIAAEMKHFSECILHNKTPTTPGEEGLADHRVMAAIEESARTGKTVSLKG
jgi:predicted dehydrogenase